MFVHVHGGCCTVEGNVKENPSEFPYRRVKLFRKTKVFQNAAKSYPKENILSSSKLKLLLSECNCRYFSEQLVRSKFVLPSKKFFQPKCVPICCVTENIKA